MLYSELNLQPKIGVPDDIEKETRNDLVSNVWTVAKKQKGRDRTRLGITGFSIIKGFLTVDIRVAAII